jgi:hypothetical protein
MSDVKSPVMETESEEMEGRSENERMESCFFLDLTADAMTLAVLLDDIMLQRRESINTNPDLNYYYARMR